MTMGKNGSRAPVASNGEKLVLRPELPVAWDRLALREPSPFQTRAWLDAWWSARGRGERAIACLVAADGNLLAGAAFARSRLGGLTPTVDDHSGDWDLVAVDDRAKEALMSELAGLRATVVAMGPLRDPAPARNAFARAGRRTHTSPGPRSPYMRLGDSVDELVAARSSKFRAQLRRSRRALERHGRLQLRTTIAGTTLERDLDVALRMEATGWKQRAGTAILSREDTTRLYREFARAASSQGWLRIHLLEVDGVPIAGDLACVIGDEAFLLKTGFDERFADSSPGLALREEVLRACIEEGVQGYDFLGGPDPYKMRWTKDVRPRSFVRGFRGTAAVPSEGWHRVLRPALATGRRRARAFWENR